LKKITRLVALLAATTLLAGCATMMSGSTQTANIQVLDDATHAPIENAKCVITDGRGVAHTMDTNPGNVLLTKGAGALVTSCQANGYKLASVGTGENFNAWTVGNLIFWPGAIVDVATGAIHKYPSHITVLMHKNGNQQVAMNK